MPDPLGGAETDPDRSQDVLDYLGRRSPLSFSNQPALPNVGAPGPSAGPAGPSGVGETAPGGQAPGLGPAGMDATGGPSGASGILRLIQQGIGAGKTAQGAAKDLVPATSPGGVSGAPGEVSGTTAAPGFGASPGDTGVGGAIMGPEGLEGGVSGAGQQGDSGSLLDLAGGSGGLQLAGAGLSAASLATLIAQLVESGKMSPGQAIGLLQSSGGTASGLASTLGPAQAGQTAGPLAGTLSPEIASALGIGGEVLGGVGAVGSLALSLKSAFDAIHAGSDDPRQYASAGGTGVGLGAGALIGTAISPGYGTLVGAGAGAAAGTSIGNVIAKNLPQTHYAAQREHWGEVATDAVNAYGFGIQKAASNGGLPELQAALSQGFADGHVRAYLTLPDAVAAAIGVPATNSFDGMSEGQFLQVLKAASQTDPAEWSRWIAGTGDVTYLDQGRAQGVAQATQQTATATLQALIQELRPVLDQLPQIAPEALEASRQWGAGAPERQAAFLAQAGPYRGATEGSGE